MTLTYVGTVSINKLYILESLPPGQETGRHLEDDLVHHLQEAVIDVELIRVRTVSEMMEKLVLIKCEAEIGTRPALHLEVHGPDEYGAMKLKQAGVGKTLHATSDGLHLAQAGEVVPLAEFVVACRRINVASKNNLVLTMSTCYGALTGLGISLKETTPFYLLAAPQNKQNSGSLLKQFGGFYKTLVKTGSVEEAAKHLAPDTLLVHSEKVLFDGWGTFVKSKAMGNRKGARIEEMVSMARQANPDLSIQDARALARNHLLPTDERLQAHKARFLMADDPENEGRFPGCYEELLAHLRST